MNASFKIILRYLKEIHPHSATLTEINKDIFPDRMHSSVYRSLSTMVERGFIKKEGHEYSYIKDVAQSHLTNTPGPKSPPKDFILPKGLVAEPNLRVLANAIITKQGLDDFLTRELDSMEVYLEFMASYFYLASKQTGSSNLLNQYWWQDFLNVYNEELKKLEVNE